MWRDNRDRLFYLMERVGKTPLMEIDRDVRFSDLRDGCLTFDTVREILNYHLQRQKMTSYQKGTLNRRIPHVHTSNIKIKIPEEGLSPEDEAKGVGIDIEGFRDLITQEPASLFGKNEKIKKTETKDSITYVCGFPAFRSLVFDLERDEFIEVNTCTGAGPCVDHCFAKSGFYLTFPGINLSGLRRLNFLLNHPERYEERLYNDIKNVIKNKKNKTVYMRWNDSGDFFVKEYFRIAFDVTKRLRDEGFDNFYSYTHTKIADVYNQGTDWFITNFSADANFHERKKVDINNAKTSEYVRKEMFNDLFLHAGRNRSIKTDEKGKPIFKDPINGPNELKGRISKEFNVDINSLLFVSELLKTPPQEGVTWNVIVLPKGDGDNAAQRLDVRRSFLLHH